MVEDDKIKTTVSPFAIREGEIKTFDGKDGYVSINQIIHKINLGHISDIHFEILNLVNEFEFMTSRQIYFLLLAKGIEIKSQDKLNTKLDQMVRTKILTRYYFTSEEGKGIYRVYCLEKMGKYLLNSREQDCKWQPTDNTKPVHLIKKRLAGNQVIVAYMRKSSNFKSYQVKPVITAKRAGKSFKAHGSVTIGNNSKTVNLLFECVRRESGWQERFTDRMRLYKDFYENFVPGDSGFMPYAPQLILVCEDDNHMVEVLREIIANELTINNVKIYFTTDLSQNSNKLDGSLTEFVIDETTGKYKRNNIIFKGLA